MSRLVRKILCHLLGWHNPKGYVVNDEGLPTENKVIQIKNRLTLFTVKRGRLPKGSDSMRKIAFDFNVTPSTIQRIKDGYGWINIDNGKPLPAYKLEEVT